MADECTDVSTVEELSLFCRWIETGEPTEHFIDLLPMKRTDAESIYSALVECLKSKNIQISNLIGMGFDGAATFSGKKSGVKDEKALTSCFICSLPLPSTSTGLCVGCKWYSRY